MAITIATIDGSNKNLEPNYVRRYKETLKEYIKRYNKVILIIKIINKSFKNLLPFFYLSLIPFNKMYSSLSHTDKEQ